MKAIWIAILFSIGLLPAFAQEAANADPIQSSLLCMMRQYPKSTLLDIYKSAFQNRYGPGHIVSGTCRAKSYLDWELDQPVLFANPLYEPTIPDSCFYRVNLSVITDSIVPYVTFFDAFLESVHDIEMPPISQWAEDWKKIIEATKALNLDLPDYETDAHDINERLANGIYAGEHSRQYVEAYDPHYRIIRRDIFVKKIKPLIDDYIASSLKNNDTYNQGEPQ